MSGHYRKRISKQPDLTLKEMQRRCKDVLGIRIGINALWYQLDRLRLRLKKTLHAKEQFRNDVKHARKLWQQQQWNPNQLIFA
ncbi:MAG: hypothetical protein WC959_07745 [Kiritimatiellales bacterium]